MGAPTGRQREAVGVVRILAGCAPGLRGFNRLLEGGEPGQAAASVRAWAAWSPRRGGGAAWPGLQPPGSSGLRGGSPRVFPPMA